MTGGLTKATFVGFVTDRIVQMNGANIARQTPARKSPLIIGVALRRCPALRCLETLDFPLTIISAVPVIGSSPP
ncbi:hypothetical protein GCM10009674_18080 [Nesterenkonia xinjiangensis]